jgi:hypothetical protein
MFWNTYKYNPNRTDHEMVGKMPTGAARVPKPFSLPHLWVRTQNPQYLSVSDGWSDWANWIRQAVWKSGVLMFSTGSS